MQLSCVSAHPPLAAQFRRGIQRSLLGGSRSSRDVRRCAPALPLPFGHGEPLPPERSVPRGRSRPGPAPRRWRQCGDRLALGVPPASTAARFCQWRAFASPALARGRPGAADEEDLEAQAVVQLSKQRHAALLDSEIVHFQRALEPHPMTLQQILAHRDAETLRLFLLEELPIRFARRLRMVESLPDWNKYPHMRMIRTLYSNAFQRLRVIAGNDAELFRSTLQSIKRRNSNMLMHVVRGVRSMKEACPALDEEQVNVFLDQFLTARIGTDILSSQYLAITRSSGPTSVIDPQCDPVQVVRSAAKDAQRLCRYHYGGHAAPVNVVDVGQVRFPFIPQYLNYIMFELVKNSLRAVAERFPGDEAQHHPVNIVVCGDAESVVIRVSDEGGGIPLETVPQVWSYLYTTAKPQGQTASADSDADDSGSEDEDVAPMAGFGCGLPLSRNYASYVGGSLELNTMPHHGVDVYLYLNRVGDSVEASGKKGFMWLPSRGYLLR